MLNQCQCQGSIKETSPAKLSGIYPHKVLEATVSVFFPDGQFKQIAPLPLGYAGQIKLKLVSRLLKCPNKASPPGIQLYPFVIL